MGGIGRASKFSAISGCSSSRSKMRSAPAMALWMLAHSTAICCDGLVETLHIADEGDDQPQRHRRAAQRLPLQHEDAADAGHDGDGHVAQRFQRGGQRRGEGDGAHVGVAVGGVALRKDSMLASSRLKACTSRTPEMLSSNSALTLPISLRVTRKALRAWPLNQTVAIAISGTTARLSSA
jgi:hypothetical protein